MLSGDVGQGGATFFHIEFTPHDGSTLYEMDLNEEEMHEFAGALAAGQTVPLGGRPVRWEQSLSMRVVKSDEPWVAVYDRTEALLRRHGVSDLQHTRQWHVFDTCEDITRSVLKQASPQRGESQTAPDPRDVFVVHGRNQKAREALFEFLQAINLRPIEFTEALAATGKPNPYIGEVLEKAFALAQAIVVFLTPDDEACLREEYREENDFEYETNLTPQARPNVLFEAGMAMGRDPDRTVLVQLGEIRPFSDVAGRHILRIDGTSQSRQQLADRLSNAGCDVRLTGVRWHTAGDFGGSVPGLVAARQSPSSTQNALLRAYLDKDLSSSGRTRHLLVLENLGSGEANSIEVMLDGVPVLEHSAVVVMQGEITQVGPHSRCHYPLSLTMGSPIPTKVSVSWINESGENGHFNSTLSL